MNKSDLTQLIESAVNKAVDRYIAAQNTYSDWITKKQAMQILGYKSPVSIDNLVRSGKLTRRYHNNRPQYKFNDIKKIKENKK